MEKQLSKAYSYEDLHDALLGLLEDFNRHLWFYYDKILDSIADLREEADIDDVAAEVIAYTLSVTEVAGSFHRKAQSLSAQLNVE